MSDLIPSTPEYRTVHSEIVLLLDTARRAAARSIKAVMTATYWEIGRRIVEFAQDGKDRARYGEALIERRANDLTKRFGRGFSQQNLWQMRQFYACWPILQIASGEFRAAEIIQTMYGQYPGANKGATEAHYSLDGLSNKVLAAEYQTVLPNEKLLADKLEKTQRELEANRHRQAGGDA